jgi:NADPH-dependent 2,4-dienoyl-CoA reductase/sulfur reductase-like enzyme
VVFVLADVGRRLGDGRRLDVLWRLVIWGDALAAGSVGNEAMGWRDPGRRVQYNWRSSNAGERCARDTGRLQAAEGNPGKLGSTRARHGLELGFVKKGWMVGH